MLRLLFEELDGQIEQVNKERKTEGLPQVARSHFRLLGQASLLTNQKISAVLSLAFTGDVDALLIMEHVVKVRFSNLLRRQNLIYDEDSYLIWLPPGVTFEPLFDFKHLIVDSIDPESALVSKAIKAPKKNKHLIAEALASNTCPGLADRIIANGGRLEDFV